MAASQSPSMQSAPGLLNLENELTCSICTDILYQPLTLLDCLHTFCGSCLKEWFRWQAEKEVSSRNRDRTRRPVLNPYTCPSCRASVRAHRPNATVTTLLDMYTQANPGRVKSADDRKEAEKGYKAGESVMPELPSEEDDDDDDSEDYGRLMDEVLTRSLRDVNILDGDAEQRTRPGNQPRSSERERREESDREERRQRRSRDPWSRNERQISTNAAPGRSGEQDTGQTAAAIRRATDRLDRASSIRISQRLAVLEVRYEEEDIMRQIVEEGLLDGIDVHNLDVRQEEEIADRIARAYRRHREQQARLTREQRTSSQEQVRRPTILRDASARQAPVPSAWQTREPQTGQPRSSSQSGRRSAEPEGGGRRRSEQTVTAAAAIAAPSAWQPLELRQPRQRSSSRGSRRAPSAEPSRRRPVEVTRTSARNVVDASVRVNTGETRAVSQTRLADRTRRSTDPVPAHLPARQTRLTDGLQSPLSDGVNSPIASAAVVASPVNTSFRTSSPTPAPNRHSPSILASSPILAPSRSCLSCQKNHIEYSLHHTCRKCGTDALPYTLCHRCYRLGKGCRHWFGFGNAAQAKFERQASPGAEQPHIMEPERYTIIQPQAPSSTVESSSTATALERGVFCSVCTANSKPRYWSCDTCNSGEWGYCDTCAARGRHCTHPLTPMNCIFVPPTTSSTSSLRSVPRLIPISTPSACALCTSPILLSKPFWSCNTCNASYCVTCRRKHLHNGNNNDPFPRCLLGHRLEGTGPSSALGGDEIRVKPPNSILKAAVDRRMLRMQALWTRVPDDGIQDELDFPRGAEITDVLDVNGEWGWGVYCGKGGLFPLGYCRRL